MAGQRYRLAGTMAVMSSYRLRYFGDPVLTTRAAEVVDIDGALVNLAEEMVDVMYDAQGVGLAAPQVGVGKRLFVYQVGDDDPIAIVNPTISEGRGEWEYEEGCLSIPGLFFPIVRPKEIHLTGFDLDGREISIEADELEARCLQHELDHLDGKLLLDMLDADQRKVGPGRAAPRARRSDPAPGLPGHAGGGRDRARRPWSAAGHDIALVVTRADARRGPAGRAPTPSPVKAAAEALGLAVSHDVDDVVAVGADLGVVVAYGRIIQPPVLGALPLVNVHFSLLPRWRGAAPVERAILAGDPVTGVCLMEVEDGLDTGPVYARVDDRHRRRRDGRRPRRAAWRTWAPRCSSNPRRRPGRSRGPRRASRPTRPSWSRPSWRLDWERPAVRAGPGGARRAGVDDVAGRRLLVSGRPASLRPDAVSGCAGRTVHRR